MLRWGLDPAQLGVYTGLRLYLDHTNRSSLGVGLGAVQEIPILRAQGRVAEAQHVADVAHTANTVTCLLYALALLAWAAIRAPLVRSDPLAAEWTWGLVAVAGLALLKRYESFLIAVLRAHQEFALTTELDIFESLVSIVAVGLGLWLAGFWGLLAGVGVILGAKIAYLRAGHPLRFAWAWDVPAAARLMARRPADPGQHGGPGGGDEPGPGPDPLAGPRRRPRRRALHRRHHGDELEPRPGRADRGGPLHLFPGDAGPDPRRRRGGPPGRPRRPRPRRPCWPRARRSPTCSAPEFLGTLMPRYAGGLPALRPLLPGTILLGLAWPARQMLIAVGRPYRLAGATLAGLAVAIVAGAIGADRAGIVGVARGMTLGYGAVAVATGLAAVVPTLGWAAWRGHQGRLIRTLLGFGAATLLTAHVPLGIAGRRPDLVARVPILAAWLLPTLWLWGRRHGWGGLLPARFLKRPR